MKTLMAFVRLGRPQFLVGGFVLYGLGAAMAVAGGARFVVGSYLLGQLVVTAAQLMTHYSNDYFDLAADRANVTPTRWSGGSRVLVGGVLRPEVALHAARACLVVAGLAAMVVGRRVGGVAWPVEVGMIVLAWYYSAPPLRLCGRGWGEVTTAVVVTLLVPVLGFLAEARTVSAALLLAALPPFGLQVAMLIAIEFPDAAGDAAAGKRTLVVRFGPAFGAKLYAAITIAAFASLPLIVRAGVSRPVAEVPLSLAPVALWQAVRVARGAYAEPARWGSVAFVAVALLIACAAAELVGALAVITRGG
jgi:1,4-dihydroxy-2-naphthoate polyprenyltransferase